MSAFDQEVYLKQEVDEIAKKLLTLKKDDLKTLGMHLMLLFDTKMLKADIQNAIIDHLGDGIIKTVSVETPVVESCNIELQHRIELVCYNFALRKKYQLRSHSNSSKGSDNSSSSCLSNDSSVEKQTSVSPSVDSKQNSSSKSSSSTPQFFVSSVTCNYCKGQGHVVSECLKLQRKHGQQSYESQPKGFVGHIVSSVQSAPVQVPTVSDDTVSAVEVTEKSLSVDGVVKGNSEPIIDVGLFHSRVILLMLLPF